MECVFKCQLCGRVLSSAQGLKSHTTRLHKQAVTVNVTHAASSQTVVKAIGTAERTASDESPSQDVISQSTSTPSDLPLVSLLANLKGNVKIIRRIPKGARSVVAEALTVTIDTCIQEQSESSWARLLLFAAVCLQVPDIQENRKVSLATLVKQNTAEFLQGRSPIRFQDFKKEMAKVNGDLHLASRVEAKMADGDVVGAVRIMSSESSFAPSNAATLQDLLNLHPVQKPSSDLVLESLHGEDHLQVSDSETRGAIVSFPPGSAGGLDMIRPQHVKDLIGPSVGNAGLKLLTSIKCLCNVMLAGQVPDVISPILYGASLCALTKKTGGIRPIAIGSVWRRLVARLGSFHVKPKLSVEFQPIQLGFGTKGGAEAAAHAARRFVSYSHKVSKVLFKIDFRNAFNTIDRSLMLQVVKERMPELFPFVSQCYRVPSYLAFGEDLISSQRGIQQGDPLGPALFCSMVHSIALDVSSEMNIWYLDDVALGGPPEEVMRDVKCICEKAAGIGLEINFSKCELFCLGGTIEDHFNIRETFRELSADIQFPELRDCTLLGAPLLPEAIETCLKAKSRTLRVITDRLGLVKAHVAFYILKNSQAIPKLSYVLRCAPTWFCEEGLHNFDDIQKMAFELISNTHLDDDAWQQAALPVAQGGLGVRHARSLALPAFLASVHAVSGLVASILPPEISCWGDPVCVEGVTAWVHLSGCEPPPEDKKALQREWEAPIVDITKARIFEKAASSQDKARLLGVASVESGAFLNAIPSSPLGTLLDNDSFRIAIGLRLGSEICQQHVCVCGSVVDSTGVHGLTCIKSAGRRARHSAVNDIIRRGLATANVPATLEPSHLSLSNNNRPDGITLVPWASGKPLLWDFTCTNPLAPCHVSSAATEPLYAARLAEEGKRRKYIDLSTSYIFAPVAVECLGSVGRESLKTLRAIGKKMVLATGEKRATEYFFQRISVAVQRGNASCVTGTIPPSSSLEEVFYVL